jgi:hypothetical protein
MTRCARPSISSSFDKLRMTRMAQDDTLRSSFDKLVLRQAQDDTLTLRMTLRLRMTESLCHGERGAKRRSRTTTCAVAYACRTYPVAIAGFT